MNNCYTAEELLSLNVHCGKNVFISKLTTIYTDGMIIGNNVRIDDFCVLTGDIKMGSNIHIANYCGLYGRGGIELSDFSNISSRCSLYSQTDDFSGNFLTGPTIPKKFTKVTVGKILLKKHALIGAGSILLPSVTLNEGCAVGAMSLILKDIPEYEIHIGIPAKFYKKRSRNLQQLEEKYLG